MGNSSLLKTRHFLYFAKELLGSLNVDFQNVCIKRYPWSSFLFKEKFDVIFNYCCKCFCFALMSYSRKRFPLLKYQVVLSRMTASRLVHLQKQPVLPYKES